MVNLSEGGELVDAIGKIGKGIRSVAKSGKGGERWLDMAGKWLVEQMELYGDNADLVRGPVISERHKS